MCGITGLLSPKRPSDPKAILLSMAHAIRHRGPDAEDAWFDGAGIGLAHRRLAIIDLSPDGQQPMRSACGRFWTVFNGEIYNYLELKHELESLGHKFRSKSDTEVILAACTEWGFEKMLPRLNGMFALAIWDTGERALHLARDRIGKKPLYYGICGSSLLFGSELKALRAHPEFQGTVDRDSLLSFLHYGYVPAPHTIFHEISQLSPGSRISARIGPTGCVELGKPERYWSLSEAATRGARNRFEGHDSDAVNELETLLKDAVKIRMMSDVPLGAFLSGGIDSSVVTALMQAQSSTPIQTYTIGYGEKSHNEAEFAAAVAKHLGTRHTELYAGADDALEIVPKLPEHYDEPFSDASQLPTFLVCQLARQHVTVTLSGDGGDEFFGGYPHYLFAQQRLEKRMGIPSVLGQALGATVGALGSTQLDRLWEASGQPLLPSRLRKLSSLLGDSDPVRLHRTLTSQWGIPEGIVLGTRTSEGYPRGVAVPDEIPTLAEKFMFLDASSYLPDDILVKVDRASMAVSMEARAPLLDYRVAELAFRLPLAMKLRDGQGKWILRQVLYRHVPRELVERPKMGFGPPVTRWLQGPLKPWAESLLDERKLTEQGYFDARIVRRKFELYQMGATHYQSLIWGLLMFQAWKEHFRA